MIKLYLLNIKDIKKVDEDFFKIHFPLRFEKAKKKKDHRDYLCAIGAGLLLFNELELEEKDIFFDKNQKPCAKDVFFNLSHSGDFVLLAVGDCEVGADIQCFHPYAQNVAKRIFSAAENEYAMKNDDGFCRLWSLKESVMKCNGRGLALGADSFDVMPFFENSSILVEDEELYAQSLKFQDYSIAVCQKAPIEELKLKQVTYN